MRNTVYAPLILFLSKSNFAKDSGTRKTLNENDECEFMCGDNTWKWCAHPSLYEDTIALEGGVKCISEKNSTENQGCVCDNTKGYIHEKFDDKGKFKKFSRCLGPKKECSDKTLKYQKYDCTNGKSGPGKCDCVSSGFNYCDDKSDKNECYKAGKKCEHIPYSKKADFVDHKCSDIPKKAILVKEENKY